MNIRTTLCVAIWFISLLFSKGTKALRAFYSIGQVDMVESKNELVSVAELFELCWPAFEM